MSGIMTVMIYFRVTLFDVESVLWDIDVWMVDTMNVVCTNLPSGADFIIYFDKWKQKSFVMPVRDIPTLMFKSIWEGYLYCGYLAGFYHLVW